jgi:hypothetical protein
MSDAQQPKSKPAEELETEIEERDENRHEHEVMLQKEVNQDIQTGTNDATHPGINWGASYTTRRKKKAKKASAGQTPAGQASPGQTNDSESKP